MPFQIIQQTLNERREPIETKSLPERFDSESKAVTAIKIKIAAADHAGYDTERNMWWAKNDDGHHVRYAAEETTPRA